MKLILLTFIFSLFISSSKYYRVYLKDKGPENFQIGTQIYQSALESLSQRSITRRKATLGNNFISLEDAPIYPDYRNSLSNYGEIKYEIKWFNYLLMDIDSNNFKDVQKLEFIKTIDSATSKSVILDYPLKTNSSISNLISKGSYSYGSSLNQVEMLGAEKLHEMGFNGENTILGFLDSGFDPRLALVRFPEKNIENYDFVSMDDSVQYQENDPINGFHHGTTIMSTVLGFVDGELLGISTNSDYYLARTEDVGSETLIEADNFIAGIEWLESKGCNVINSSLGYRYFDSGNQSYNFEDLDGNTTLVSQAVNKSVSRGIVHITSAGNSGNRDSTIIAPADADSVLSVAGVDSEKNVWNLSSRGPRSGEGIFPNISAKGTGVVFAATSDPNNPQVGVGSGTSFSSPLIAGCVSLLRSAFPELAPWQVRSILFESSSNYQSPNFEIGYGIPNMERAFELAGIAIADPSYYTLKNNQTRITTFIKYESNLESAIIGLYNPNTSSYDELEMKSNDNNLFYFDVDDDYFFSDTLKYYIRAFNSNYVKRLPYSETETLMALKNNEKITCGVDPLILPTNIETSVAFSSKPNIYIKNNILHISSNTRNKGIATIEIYDINGKLLQDEFFNYYSGKSIISIPLTNPRRLYFVKAKSKDFHIIEQILVLD
ncbi:S8 family serine peptidase [Candidatus Kapabacteria bacterium]|nr:S8 family serine peptidase [Candidatus Kapabacteria bacterium]